MCRDKPRSKTSEELFKSMAVASVLWGEVSNRSAGQFCYVICRAFFFFISLLTPGTYNDHTDVSHKDESLHATDVIGQGKSQSTLLSR